MIWATTTQRAPSAAARKYAMFTYGPVNLPHLSTLHPASTASRATIRNGTKPNDGTPTERQANGTGCLAVARDAHCQAAGCGPRSGSRADRQLRRPLVTAAR